MKISIVIVEGSKQIMLTPETDHEKQALKFVNPKDTLKVVSHWGQFADESLEILKCQGNYLRAFSLADSLMFLIEDDNGNSEEIEETKGIDPPLPIT